MAKGLETFRPLKREKENRSSEKGRTTVFSEYLNKLPTSLTVSTRSIWSIPVQLPRGIMQCIISFHTLHRLHNTHLLP